MQIISAFLLLIPAFAAASDRALQIGDWHVTTQTLIDQGLTFETGPGAGSDPNIKITVMNLCRLDSPTRKTLGSFYPSNTVPGIDADSAGIINNPGGGNSLDWRFLEGISDNADIYTDNGDNTAKVEFCIEIGLYDGIMLIDYSEVWLTYNIDLVTNVPALTGYTVTQAEAFTDAEDTALSFDGTLLAYFCDPDTTQIITDDGSVTTQGSTLTVCFRVDEGQFEVKDIMEFTVRNALAADPSQLIITNSAPASSIFSTKTCNDAGVGDNNVCVVSFLLMADFYDFEALTLTGEGSILLELGGNTGAARDRRMLRKNLKVVDGRQGRMLQDQVTETVEVQPHSFGVEKQHLAGSSADTAMASLAAFGAIAGAALAL